jgi:hypothetical protein
MPASRKKKLPIGIQDFARIRQEDYCYVDKTPLIARLVEQGCSFFLSRPRRFGKSLLLDTIAQAFAGHRELFSGLYLEKHWDWSMRYPVIKIDLAQGIIDSRQRLDQRLLRILNLQAEQYDLQIESDVPDDCLQELIIKLRRKTGQRVVVLVDEYDKPILDNITKPEKAVEQRDGLRNIYSVLKAQGADLHFVMLTGVSRFSRVSLFSGLNNLQDITLDSRYGTICGYTQHELDTVFTSYLEGVDLQLVKKWYNGYNFLAESVYNPFDILLYLDSRNLRPYWFETGTPTFLIDLLKAKKSNIPSFADLTVGENLLSSFDIDFIEPAPLLFQTGYLTIKQRKRHAGQIRYQLGFPNQEVRTSLMDSILNRFAPDIQQKETTYNEILAAFQENDLERLHKTLHTFFASIPHDWYRKNNLAEYEGYYCSMVYCYFSGLGLDIRPEDTTNHGQIDMTVLYEDRAYIIEFKVNELCAPGRALQQIQDRKYHQKYNDRTVYLVGMEFSKTERNIVLFEWQEA